MIQTKSGEGLDGEEIGFKFGEVEKAERTLRERWHFFRALSTDGIWAFCVF